MLRGIRGRGDGEGDDREEGNGEGKGGDKHMECLGGMRLQLF